jgi:DNA-binding response OmpR family regulator
MKMSSFVNKTIIKNLISALAESEFEWAYVSKEFPAETLLKQYEFNLVVLDGSVGNIETTCRNIKEINNIPIVLVIEHDYSDWREMHYLDVDSYIYQGTNGTELIARLRAVLRRFQNGGQPGNNKPVPEHPRILIRS